MDAVKILAIFRQEGLRIEIYAKLNKNKFSLSDKINYILIKLHNTKIKLKYV